MDIISIVIPMYNSEKYIKKCIESIIKQTYKKLQIIIIDDGSTDESGTICKEFCKKDNRIEYFYKKNQGVSSARNLAIDKIIGRYVIFIDSDDWIEKNMIELLHENIKKYNADISICGYDKIYQNGKVDISECNYKNKIYTKNKIYMYENLLNKHGYKGYLWNKLIKTDLIKKADKIIYFNEKVHLQEDLLFLCEVLKNTKSIICDTNNKLYHYIQRSNSAISSKYSIKYVSKLIVLEYLINLKKYMKIDALEDIEFEYVFSAIKSKYIVKKLNINDDKLNNKIKEIEKKYYKYVFYESKINIKNKIKLLMIKYMPKLCEIISKKGAENNTI